MRLNGYIKLAVAVIILPLIVSCRHELCYDHYPSVKISFSWEQEWERDYGQYHFDIWNSDYFGRSYDDLRPWIPEWVNMIMYTDDGRPSEQFLSPDGTKLIVEEDQECSILFYNGDTEYIILSDMASLHDARATATLRSRSSLGLLLEHHPDARTTNPPDVLYSAFLEHVSGVKNHELRQLPIKMQPLVYTYVITYEFEHGIEHVANARGALGGMAESVYLKNGTTSDQSSIILFDCYIRPNGCQAEVRSFGVPGFPDKYFGSITSSPQPPSYTLNLEVMLRNGKVVDFNFDISDQIVNQPRGGVIKITGLRIEDDEGQSQAGFEVDVDNWDNAEVIDLPLGSQQF